MGRTLKEKVADLPLERRRAVEQNAASIIGAVKAANQLRAARYTYHRQMIHKYGSGVLSDEITMTVAEEMYRRSMANYDSIIEKAADGASQEANEANEADMKEGFNL